MSKDDLDILNNLMQKYSLDEILGGLETLCMERAEYEALELSDTKLAKKWIFHGALLRIFKDGLKGK